VLEQTHAAFGVSNPADVTWMEARLTGQPLKTMTQAVSIAADISARVPHTFVLCTKANQFVGAPREPSSEASGTGNCCRLDTTR
jgi:hypothetical protein